jgi:hypothetical protein
MATQAAAVQRMRTVTPAFTAEISVAARFL